MTNNKIMEKDMVNALECYYKNNGVKKIYKEVQLCSKFIDMLIQCECGKIITIEAKISAPSRAFKQAGIYRHMSDFVYVAILKNGSNKTALELSKKTGIGLIFVSVDSNGESVIEVVRESEKSDSFNEIIKNYVLEGQQKTFSGIQQ